MAWRSESWEELVARAAKTATRPSTAAADATALAARAELVTFQEVRLALGDGRVTVGGQMESVEFAFTQIYHLEPVDPWPSLALGWVERSVPYRAVLTPIWNAERFAAAVEQLVTAYDRRVTTHAMPRGWLSAPVLAWERCEALPGEKPEGPMMRGYRMAPEVPDPVLATRKINAGNASLWQWLAARLRATPRRIDPVEVIVTRRFVYARTRAGDRLRLPADTLRTSQRTTHGDGVYVFGRHTELLLVHQPECPVARTLDARLGATS